ncbi:Panacea domain-containing protein [Mixta mediterraneensis]|uniref:Panacea domain-containing protein n=1 Tax=Mixta mediterraneensis TaxID=2758443 RepID=UPI001EED89E0|nr:Panacea domain-containing protein [Mixta mediterraneensis]
MFSVEKSAQMAAYLLHKRGGQMSFLKLMKLLYLSDRKSLELYGEPISGDRYVSMNYGPVLSNVYSLIADGSEPGNKWEKWIRDGADHTVVLRQQFDDIYELTELSRADVRTMDDVYEQYGHWNRFDLCDETHRICPEWQDPHGSSIPIRVEDIFKALGRSAEESEALARDLMTKNQLELLTSDLR